MPMSVTCPNCHRTIRVPDGFAGRGICPDCRSVVAMADEEPARLDPLPDDPYPAKSRPRRRPPTPLDHLPAWRRVSTGFLVQQAAAVLLFIGLALVTTAMLALGDDPGNLNDEPNTAQMVTGCVGLFALFLGLAVQLVGRFISAGTPVRSPRIPGFLAASTSILVLLGYCLVGCVFVAIAAEQDQGNDPDEATTLAGLLLVGWLMMAAAGETCHALAVGSVGRVLRADGARLLGRGLAVFIPIASVFGLFLLCAIGIWTEANNANGGANPPDDTLRVLFFGGLSAAIGLYLVVHLILLHQGRAAVTRLAADAGRAGFDDRWD